MCNLQPVFDRRLNKTYHLDMKRMLFITFIGTFAAAAVAGAQEQSGFDPDLRYAQVRKVIMEENTDGSWTFSVTIRHADSGWDHYADLWQVMAAGSGEVIGERPLAHPHTNEQPFTRSLSGVTIPSSVKAVVVRAKCTRHGFEGTQVRIALDEADGEDYRIRRAGE
jgi:hypothetical protein